MRASSPRGRGRGLEARITPSMVLDRARQKSLSSLLWDERPVGFPRYHPRSVPSGTALETLYRAYPVGAIRFACHPERSEGPCLDQGRMGAARSFASLRMTSGCRFTRTAQGRRSALVAAGTLTLPPALSKRPGQPMPALTRLLFPVTASLFVTRSIERKVNQVKKANCANRSRQVPSTGTDRCLPAVLRLDGGCCPCYH